MVYALCFFHIKAYVFLLSNYVIKKKGIKIKNIESALVGLGLLIKKKLVGLGSQVWSFCFFLFFFFVTLVASTFLKDDMICLQ